MLRCLANFETCRYYDGVKTCNSIFKRNKLPSNLKTCCNLDEYVNTGTHWIDGFGVEFLPLEVVKTFCSDAKVTLRQTLLGSTYTVHIYGGVLALILLII